MKHKKIVVTGLGVVSPIGSTIDKMWNNALEGVCGIRKIPELVELGLPVQIAGNIIDFDPNTYISPKNQKKMDLFIQYGMAAATQAIQDAGLEASPSNAERIGVAIGSGIGGLDFIEKNYDKAKEKGVRKVSPFFIPGTIINMIAGNLTIEYGFKGPNMGMVSACTTGTHNIGEAARMIDYGTVDVM
ncbi:MAG: beta-ketoacyl synthase N-terminal-like domain-containing protein, partial [Candidatus Oxydemutatoraceae bacterium WSBS_2016_MAG_OTU14]